MNKKITVELNLNKASDFNEYIEKSMVSMIKDILEHFEKRARKPKKDEEDENERDIYYDDARYLYKQTEVDMFFKMNNNPNLKVEPLFDAGENVPWCWKVSRINKKK